MAARKVAKKAKAKKATRKVKAAAPRGMAKPSKLIGGGETGW